MEPVFEQSFEITDSMVDRYGRMKSSQLLYLAQEMGGLHCVQLELDYDALAERRMFWAVTRHRMQVTRLPRRGETIRVETWPLPTTKVTFPRSVVAYDQDGNELFRAISLWVLMDLDTRKMILPGKSGISVVGTLRGTELPAPGGLAFRDLADSKTRTVCFTDLDRNGHMNNTRYMDWIDDLFPSDFHCRHELCELTICYHAEATEGQDLCLQYALPEDTCVQVDAQRITGGEPQRVFSARLIFE